MGVELLKQLSETIGDTYEHYEPSRGGVAYDVDKFAAGVKVFDKKDLPALIKSLATKENGYYAYSNIFSKSMAESRRVAESIAGINPGMIMGLLARAADTGDFTRAIVFIEAGLYREAGSVVTENDIVLTLDRCFHVAAEQTSQTIGKMTDPKPDLLKIRDVLNFKAGVWGVLNSALNPPAAISSPSIVA